MIKKQLPCHPENISGHPEHVVRKICFKMATLSLLLLFSGCGTEALEKFFTLAGLPKSCGVTPSLLKSDFFLQDASDLDCSVKAHTLYVTQLSGVRVTSYNIPLSDGAPAVNILGQSSFNTSTTGTTASTFGTTGPTHLPANKMGNDVFVADIDNNRVLIFDTSTTTNGEAAVNVFGQANFTSGGTATTQSGMSGPDGIDFGDNKLFVADSANNRVTVYDIAVITNGENAQNVLGQSNFTSSGTGTTSTTMSTPFGIAYDSGNKRLFVGDNANHRVLVFDVTAITDGEAAVNVLGQADFTSGSANRGGSAGQNTLSNNQGMAYYNNKLFIADTDNNRVVIYNVATITNGKNAANVLGQANFTATATATTQAGLNGPTDMVVDASRNILYVADQNNHRVISYNIADPITDGANALNVIGQSTFTTSANTISQSGMAGPHDVGLR